MRPNFNTTNILPESCKRDGKLKCQCRLLSSPLQTHTPVMSGVAAAMHCRSERENDRQGELRRGRGGDGSLSGDCLPCGGRGGRQEEGDGEMELDPSPLL
ncbi:hypothetical protein ACFXTH_018074 [Malus domestica]